MIDEDIIEKLINHKYSEPFLKPVTKKIAPDYFEIIKKPMDLSSIKGLERSGLGFWRVKNPTRNHPQNHP